MIQGGDYENADGTGGTSSYGESFEDEFCDKLFNIRGAVSMANSGLTQTEVSSLSIRQHPKLIKRTAVFLPLKISGQTLKHSLKIIKIPSFSPLLFSSTAHTATTQM